MPILTLKTNYNLDANSLTFTNDVTTPLLFPEVATHLELTFAVLVFDFDMLTTTLFKSNLTVLSKNDTVSDLNLVLTETPTGNGMRFPILFCNYVQEVNVAAYYLRDGNCFGLRVLDVIY
jgi:hypothetical protein